jgi:hypothetical protein
MWLETEPGMALSHSSQSRLRSCAVRWVAPGGGHKFYEELGPATRNGTPDRTVVAAIFEKHDMSLLGPPLSTD